MERLLKDEKQIDAKAHETIVAKVMEDKLDEIRDTNKKLIEDKLSLFQQNLEAKLENLLSEDRKSAQSWSEVTQRNAPLVKGLGTIMKKTIENERLEQADQEKREKTSSFIEYLRVTNRRPVRELEMTTGLSNSSPKTY